jgi:thiamine biosynthesis lipoprotein
MALPAIRWSALGTSVHVLVTEEGALDAVAGEVASLLDQVDETMSRFRADSELSAVNAAAGREVEVSPLLARAIDAALQAASATDGAVDPTVGRAMQAIGYDADFAALAGRADAPTIRLASVPGWRAVRFDRARRRVRLPKGVELDLGSTGKALAADLAAGAAFGSVRGGGVLVNLGGDIAVAGEAPDEGWRIALADDARSDPSLAAESMLIRSGAVATSSTTVRRWMRGGIERHHIVDPSTGRPAEGPWRTVTVVAADCVAANAAATGAIVKGVAAVRWLSSLGLPARLVADDGTVVRLGPWADAGPGTPRMDLDGSPDPDRGFDLVEAYA